MLKPALFAVPIALVATLSSQASIVTIDFESDPAGPVPNGFVSVDSPLVSFSDSDGSDLAIGNFGIASEGQGLMVGRDDASSLLIDFSAIVNSLSIDFGNDDPNLTQPGDTAILSVYLGTIFVGQSVVELNRNLAMDQTISFNGAAFDNATVEFYASSRGVAKTFDHIVFNTVPGPGGMGLLILAAQFVRTRRRARC